MGAKKGHIVTAETRAKISAARKGRSPSHLSAEHRAAISAALKGHIRTPEHRANISKAHKGVPETPASRAANSRAQTGKKMSEEAKRKIGDASRGPRNARWKGGVAKVGRFDDPRYYIWQAAVFDRDDHTCQHCGYYSRRSEKLNAHHIKAWADHPEDRYDVANGLTLCVTCHNTLHGRTMHVPEPRPCSCGCGGMLAPDSVKQGRRYIIGHNQRGKPRPQHEREAISRALKGRTIPPEVVAKITASQRRRAMERRQHTSPPPEGREIPADAGSHTVLD